MKIFDRYKGALLDRDHLPENIDLGRFYIQETRQDLTNRLINVGEGRFIHQEILENQKKDIQSLFCLFLQQERESSKNDFGLKPIIQRIKSKLFLDDFEVFLEENLFHLEEIFQQPHYLLQKTIEKVNVSRAKRIPAKSYQHLASHTEDWLHKSIVDFKPRRILNEELELHYNVFENQITVALIERILRHIERRITHVEDLIKFLNKLTSTLTKQKKHVGWFQKNIRSLTLIGYAYEDQNYKNDTSDRKRLANTQKRLLEMQNRLKALQTKPLYKEISNRTVQTLVTKRDIRVTNVIANHKHYRYVRELWMRLNDVDGAMSESKLMEYEQDVISGVRSYAKILIAYVVKDVLGYEISGNYSSWNATKEYACDISLSEKNGILSLHIGKRTIEFVAIANKCQIEKDELKKKNLYIMSLCEDDDNGTIVSIHPHDSDSVERVGRIIREYIIKDYLDRINEHFEYPQILKDYTKYIESDYVIFDLNYTYSFTGIPQSDINDVDAIRGLESDDRFNHRSRPDRDLIRTNMKGLVSSINVNAKKILSLLVCQNIECQTHIQRRDAKQLEYLACSCGFVLDSTGGHVIFRNKDSRYSGLTSEDWGMDYVEFDIQ